MAGDNPLGDIFGKNFGAGGASEALRAFSQKEEKGQPWRAKVIDGQYYIPLSQVADLLRENGVLPKVRAGIERRVQALMDAEKAKASQRKAGKTAAAERLNEQ